MIRRSPAVVAALVAAFSTGAQQPKQPPVFGVGTRVVLVDVVVSGSGDRAVEGLSASDFIVKEDGKERPIVSFAAFGPRRASVGPEDVVVEPYPTSRPEPPSPPSAITVLFIDDGQMAPLEATKLRPALKRLLASMAEHNAALALVAPWSKISIAKEVEGNRAVFEAAIEKIQGRRSEEATTMPMADAEAIAIERGDTFMLERLTKRIIAMNPGMDQDQAQSAARSRATEVSHYARIRRKDAYGVLLQSLDWMMNKPGRHSVVMVSGGFAADPDDDELNEIVTRSLVARAPIHFVDSRGLQAFDRFQDVSFGPALDRDAGEAPFAFTEAAAGSADLAVDTGGLVIRNTNDFEKGLARLFETMTHYYILGYEPPDRSKPGFRKIKVEIKPKGLKVLARRGYYDKGTGS